MPPAIDIAGSAAYLVTGGICLWTARTATARAWWRGLAVFFVILALSRLLDLEGLARETLKASWTGVRAYDDRGAAQVTAIAAAGALGLATILWAWRPARAGDTPVMAVLGIAGLIGLAVLRTVSWHGSDRFLYAALGPVRLHVAAELACLAMVIVAALGSRNRKAA